MSFAKLKRCGYLFKLFLLVLSVVLSVKLWKKYRLLQELQQSQQTAPFSDLNKDILIFNRVPKSGTEMFVKLLQRLSRKNNFTHYRYGQPVPRQLPSFVQVCFELPTTAVSQSFKFIIIVQCLSVKFLLQIDKICLWKKCFNLLF